MFEFKSDYSNFYGVQNIMKSSFCYLAVCFQSYLIENPADSFFYAPNFEKVGSILLSACASVQKNLKLGF